MKKIGLLLLMGLCMATSLTACDGILGNIGGGETETQGKIQLESESMTVIIGQERKIEFTLLDEDLRKNLTFTSDSDCVSVDHEGNIKANAIGMANITIKSGKDEAKLLVNVIDKIENQRLELSGDKKLLPIGAVLTLSTKYFLNNKEEALPQINYRIIEGNDLATISNDRVTAVAVGIVKIVAEYNDLISNELQVEIVEDATIKSVELRSDSYYLWNRNGSATLTASAYPEGAYDVSYEILEGSELITLEGNKVTAIKDKLGTAKIKARILGHESNIIDINVVGGRFTPDMVSINIDRTKLKAGEVATLSYEALYDNARQDIKFSIISGKDNAEIIGNKVYAFNDKEFSIQGEIDGVKSNTIVINAKEVMTDPYTNIKTEGQYKSFYKTYTPATSYQDAMFRTKHKLMSGSIAKQDQKPTISANQPKENGKLVRNSEGIFSNDGNIYYVVNYKGEIVNVIYKGAAYVTLEEVAAHVFAFGEAPANQTPDKHVKPRYNNYGQYLRANDNFFSGDTKGYPSEPALPDISGVGNGQTRYYEMDLGTTGTDCDPKYKPTDYNNGKTIVRGAARIVYTKESLNGDPITDINDRHVFYTYNHYNDFQEYLNYQNGWGEMFGNITGGGVLSSKNPALCNPTPYVDVTFAPIKLSNTFTLY